MGYMDDEEHRQTMQRLYHPKKQHMKTATTTTTCTNIKNDSSELRKSDSTAGPPSFCADDIMPHIFDGTESRMSASFNFENIQYLDNINNKSANIENKSMETVSDKFCAGFIIESEENLDDAHTDNSKTSKKSRKRKKSKRSEVTSNQQKESILISRTNSDRSSASNLNQKHMQRVPSNHIFQMHRDRAHQPYPTYLQCQNIFNNSNKTIMKMTMLMILFQCRVQRQSDVECIDVEHPKKCLAQKKIFQSFAERSNYKMRMVSIYHLMIMMMTMMTMTITRMAHFIRMRLYQNREPLFVRSKLL